MLDNNEIEYIKKNTNIVDIISSYITLTPKGKNFLGVCPFHEDHSPSMSVSPEKQIYKCFSCGATGTVFTFVSEFENVSFAEAVKIVAEKSGLPFKGLSNKLTKPKINKEAYEIMNLALKYYQNNLNSEEGKKALKYLEDRKLSLNTIKEFNIGLSLGPDKPLNKLLLNKKYNIDTLLDLGLINRNNNYITDIFNNRIMFPIHNLEGDAIGFTGRIYEDSNQAKYINSKESRIFKKGQILFNYHRAKHEIKLKKEVIIVEGNMDAIRMYDSGLKNVVALMGTSLTDNQVEILKKLRAKIILMLDNDNAGELATFTNGNILEKFGLSPFVIRLSGAKDPDEYIIKNGLNGIIENLKKPLSFLDFKLKYLKKNKDLSKTDDLVKYIKDIINSIKDINDDLTKELTIKKMSEEYDVPISLLQNELKKVALNPKNVQVLSKTVAKKPILKYDKAAQNILYFMMNDGKYIERFKKDLGYFNNKLYRSIAGEVIYYYEQYQKISLSDFLTYIATKEDIYDEIMGILKRINIEDLTMDAFEEFIATANKESLNNEIKELKTQIASELDANKSLELANKLVALKKELIENGK